MKYNVHLYIASRRLFKDIEAASQEEAVKIAEGLFEPDSSFPGGYAGEALVWDEGPLLGALVDEQGDDEYENTHYYEGEGAQLYVGDPRLDTARSHCRALLKRRGSPHDN